MSKFQKGDILILITCFDRYLQECTCIGYDSSEVVRCDFSGIQDSFHESHLQLKSEYDMQNKTEVEPIPFDLERAKNGDKVINASGQNVRIICFDRKEGDSNIVALHDEGNREHCQAHFNDGKGCHSHRSLFMAPVEKTEWIAVIKHIETGASFIGSISAATEEELIRRYESSIYGIVCTKKITWEE